MSHSTQAQIDRKNKIVGISVISVVTVILVVVIIAASILSSSGAITSNGNLMEKYKINRQTAKLTDGFKSDYFRFATKVLNQQVENGGNTAISLTDTAITLSFLASASNGKTRTQIESLLGDDAVSFASKACYLDENVKYVKDKKGGLLSSNTAWLNSALPFGINKYFLKENANRFGLNIQRFDFRDVETSNSARKMVVDITNKNSLLDTQFTDTEVFNVVSGSSFRAAWKNPTSTKDLYDDVFLGDNASYNCKFFRTKESNYISAETFSGIAKEFVDGYTFIGLVPNLPDQETIYTTKDVVSELKEKDLIKELFNATSKTSVAVTLPYCLNNTSANVEFSQSLKSLGVTSIFNNSADLSGIAKDEGNIKLDNYYISGDISITPAGTINEKVDNRVTMDELRECTVSVEFNRSFIYFIYDNESQLPIYLGVVNHIQ